MSILIRGMEMPKSCNECIMSIEQACMINGNIISNYWARLDRPTDCPLVELPPHGRLIDADALTKEAYDSGQYANAEVGFHQRVVDVEDIEDAPTIIEAEVAE